MKTKHALMSVCAALMAATNVMAAESAAPASAPAAGTSTAVESAKAASVSDFVSVVYSTTFHGAPLSDPLNYRASGPTGSIGPKSQPQYFDGDITAMYKVSHNFGVGIYVPFLFSPLSGLSDNVPTRGLTNGDTGIAFSFHKFIDTGAFTVSSKFYIQAPTSSYSQSRKMDVGLKATPELRYQEKGSDWAFGAYTELKDYAGSISGKNIKIWALPYAKYAVSDSLAVQLAYEVETDHNVGGEGLKTYETDFQPGIIWSISKNLSINPYVQLFTTPTTEVNPSRTAIGAFIRAQII